MPAHMGCTLKEAAELLKIALGGKFFSIQMRLVFHVNGTVISEWNVYDCITNDLHMASTLAGAVNACIGANSSPVRIADPIPEIDAALEPELLIPPHIIATGPATPFLAMPDRTDGPEALE